MKKWIIIKLTSLFMALFVLVGIMYVLMYDNFFNGYNHNSIFQTPYSDSNDYSSGSIFANDNFNFSYYNYDDPYYNANPDEPYNIGDASVDSSNIKEIYIDWTVGNIDIVETDDTAISIKEKCLANSDDNKLRYRVVDNTLEIRYMNLGVSFAGNSDSKKLILGLPESKKGEFEVRTNGTKCNISVRDITLSDLTATTVYGDLTVNNSKIYNLYYYAQEGNIYTNCSSNGISVTLGQGTADCTFDNSCKDINLNVDNGKITVRLPEDIPGYLARVDFSKMSDSVGFGSDFNDKEENGDYSHTRTYGDESLNIYAEISEGRFDIKKR